MTAAIQRSLADSLVEEPVVEVTLANSMIAKMGEFQK